jgi:hypothetical protein
MTDHSFESLRAMTRHTSQVFGRSITCEIYRPEEGILAITRMHDDFHDIELALLVDVSTLNITTARARMDRIPFGTCFEAIPALHGLEGLHIFQPGVLKEAHRRIPRELGCTHLGEMFESTLRALFAHVASYQRNRLKDVLTREERRQLNILNPSLRGSCRTFRAADQDPETVKRAQDKLHQLMIDVPITTRPGPSDPSEESADRMTAQEV